MCKLGQVPILVRFQEVLEFYDPIEAMRKNGSGDVPSWRIIRGWTFSERSRCEFAFLRSFRPICQLGVLPGNAEGGKPKATAKPKAKGRPKMSAENRASFFETMWKRESNKQRVKRVDRSWMGLRKARHSSGYIQFPFAYVYRRLELSDFE